MTEAEVRATLAKVLNSSRPMEWPVDYKFLGDSVDSLDHMALVLQLQEANGIVIPDEDLPRIDTIAHVMEYVSHKLGKGA